jgi:hypothetical protein
MVFTYASNRLRAERWAGQAHCCPAQFVLVPAHNIDSTATETFANVTHRSGTNVMRQKATVFEQVVQQFPWQHFDRLVREHGADNTQRGFTSRKHFLALLAGALGGQQGLRPTVAGLAPNSGALRPLGGKAPARSTLADANRTRPADLFVELMLRLIGSVARRLARRSLREAVRLIDSTHLDLGRRMHRWFGLTQGRVAAKLHVVFDPAAQRPVYFALTPARTNDITAAKDLIPIEKGATYVFDLGYCDYAWWAALDKAGSTFVTRLRHNTRLRETTERPVPEGTNILSDRVGRLSARLASSRANPFGRLGREVTVRISTGKVLRLFTNDLTSSAEAIADLYKERWQIELFFKWIKQNLKIARFMGSSENAIRIQIAVAMIAYLLVQVAQQAQTKPVTGATILLIVRMHLFVRRPLAALLDPRTQQQKPPPKDAPLLEWGLGT